MAKKKTINQTPALSDDELSKYQGDQGLAARWIKELDLVESSHSQRAFEQHGERISKKYKNADALVLNPSQSAGGRVMYNILHSNVKILKPALFARMPKVVVERRFKDSDPIGNLACRIAERCTTYMLSSQQDRYIYANSSAVEDLLLVGRGITWLRYSADFIEEKDEEGRVITDAEGNPVKQIKPNSERVWVDPLCWSDYLESLSRNQYEVRWRARCLYWTRQQCIAELGKELGSKIQLDYDPSKKKRNSNDEADNDFLKQAKVWLIADYDSKQFIWINKNYKDAPLRVVKDPLGLNDFFPCPRPLLATTTTDSSYPTPDFVIYEKLADELDFIVKRMSSMTNCIRLVGAIASQYNKDVKSMLTLGDGAVMPIDNWPVFSERGGFSGIIDWLPFEQCVNALPVLSERVVELKTWIDEITGIPDILRGASDPNETLGAQQMKGRSLAVKLEERRADVQRFNRETISKMAQIIFEPGLFSDETIGLMCGINQLPEDDKINYPQALELLRSDRLSTFRVDIETDSTIALDESEDQESRMQYMQAINQLVSNIEQVSAFRPELIQPMIQSALFATRSFRTGRQLEGAWEKALDEMVDNDAQAKEQASQQPPPPDYEMMKAENEQAKTQVEMTKAQVLQGEFQLKQIDQEFKQFIEQSKLGLENQALSLKAQEIQQDGMKLQMDAELKAQQLQIDASVANSKIDVDQMALRLEAFTKDFEQKVASQKLELDKVLGELAIQEKLMEEKRLANDSQIQVAKVQLEAEKNIIELKKMTHDLNKKESESKEPTKSKKRVHKITKTDEGFIGESIDSDD